MISISQSTWEICVIFSWRIERNLTLWQYYATKTNKQTNNITQPKQTNNITQPKDKNVFTFNSLARPYILFVTFIFIERSCCPTPPKANCQINVVKFAEVPVSSEKSEDTYFIFVWKLSLFLSSREQCRINLFGWQFTCCAYLLLQSKSTLWSGVSRLTILTTSDSNSGPGVIFIQREQAADRRKLEWKNFHFWP